MKMFGKKAETLKDVIERYVKEMRGTIKLFENFFMEYIREATQEKMLEIAREVRHSETRCDDVRREVQALLYTGAFMPDFRGDIFDLIERADRVPNKIEELAVFVSFAFVHLPKDLEREFETMVIKTILCANSLADAVELVMVDLDKAAQKAKYVEEVESEIDKIERHMMHVIFHHNDIDQGTKILFKKFVEGISSISDKAEDASDRIELMAIKRKH